MLKKMKKPVRFISDSIKWLLPRLLFPLIFLLDGLSYLLRPFLFKKFNSYLEAQISLPQLDSLAGSYEKEVRTRHYGSAKEVEIETYDGVRLKPSLTLATEYASTHPKEANHLILFSEPFVDPRFFYRTMLDTVSCTQAKVILASYRSGNLPNGRPALCSLEDFVIDGIAQVQQQIDLGIPPKNITLYGLGMGGAVASRVAAYFYRIGSPVKLFCDRSIASVSTLLATYYKKTGELLPNPSDIQAIQAKANKPSWIKAKCMSVLIKGLAWFLRSDLNAVEAFKSIPSNLRDAISIKKIKGASVIIEDSVVPSAASLQRGVFGKMKNSETAFGVNRQTVDRLSLGHDISHFFPLEVLRATTGAGAATDRLKTFVSSST